MVRVNNSNYVLCNSPDTSHDLRLPSSNALLLVDGRDALVPWEAKTEGGNYVIIYLVNQQFPHFQKRAQLFSLSQVGESSASSNPASSNFSPSRCFQLTCMCFLDYSLNGRFIALEIPQIRDMKTVYELEGSPLNCWAECTRVRVGARFPCLPCGVVKDDVVAI